MFNTEIVIIQFNSFFRNASFTSIQFLNIMTWIVAVIHFGVIVVIVVVVVVFDVVTSAERRKSLSL